MKKNLFLILLLSLSANAFSKAFNLSESSLKKLVDNNPPGVQEIMAISEANNLQYKSIYENLGYSLIGNAAYANRDEKPVHAYDTIISPVRSLKVGIQKPTEYGVTMGLSGYTDQVTSSSMKDQTSSGLELSLSFNLYKDLLGSSTRASLKSSKQLAEMGKLEGQIGKKAYLQNLRKIYWALVANNEKIKLTQKLLKNSERQAKNAKRRHRDSVADKGEVAKFESQVASRKANIIYLEYQKETQIQKLKELLPELAEDRITLDEYNLDGTVMEVLTCTNLISKTKTVPQDYTLYDEVISLLNESYKNQAHVTSKYSDMDINLVSNIKTVGKSNSFSDSLSKHQDDRRANLELALNVTIPLGFRKSETKTTKEVLEKLQFKARYNSLSGKIKTYHKQVNQQIGLLQRVFKNQKINSEKLEISLRTTKKKYNQARIAVYNLINDQDAHLQSQLAEIDTKLAVVTTLLDYLTIFTELPCDFNRK